MTYRLFIDDERFPPSDGKLWKIARNIDEVMRFINDFAMPYLISFDHDLGENQKTGYDIAKLLVDYDMDGIVQFPEHFEYRIHSENPVGKLNIESYLNNYFEHIDEARERAQLLYFST